MLGVILCTAVCLTRCLAASMSQQPPEWNLPEAPPLQSGAAWGSSGISNHRCVAIPSTMLMCYGIGYSEMRLPNMLNHESAKEVEQQTEHWMPLVNTACHREIRVLLCSIYAPVCIQRLPERSIKPCRSLCRSVQASCLAIMEKFGFTWPDMLNCTQFPPEHDLMCIKRSVSMTDVAAQSADCQACVSEPSYESLVSAYCMNDVVLKARLDHSSASSSTPTADTSASERRLQFKGQLRFFSAPPRHLSTQQSQTSATPLPDEEQRRQRRRQRQRRQNRAGGGRLRGLRLPGGGRIACSPSSSCPLLDRAALQPKRRYLVMGALASDGTSIDVKFLAEWDNRRPAFKRALRSIRRDARQRANGRNGAGLCRGGVGMLGLTGGGVTGGSVGVTTAPRRRNRRRGMGGKRRKKNQRRTEDAEPAES